MTINRCFSRGVVTNILGHVDGWDLWVVFQPHFLTMHTVRLPCKPIAEISDNIRFPAIIDNIQQVIDTGEVLEKEIQTKDQELILMIRLESRVIDSHI